ncbi:hypothetical protein [Actinoplanes sp. GCM10030250]|uniref:hypothetical protein n=1 Tax=Actinoplanes sp. GCM10030250 TaxID=3273376 RepID=UPI00361247F9
MTDESTFQPPLSPDPPAPPGQEDLRVPDLPLPLSEEREIPEDAGTDEATD